MEATTVDVITARMSCVLIERGEKRRMVMTKSIVFESV
jgi:hypothetical protein